VYQFVLCSELLAYRKTAAATAAIKLDFASKNACAFGIAALVELAVSNVGLMIDHIMLN
jgi:hypothetical protein